jgi:uncharacterized pyridoxamine 5'-phosphate oxidase family protein
MRRTQMPKNKTLKLYKVMIQKPGVYFYVVATDTDTAYEKVRADLDARDYYFYKDRRLKAVYLLAEASETAEFEQRLFWPVSVGV